MRKELIKEEPTDSAGEEWDGKVPDYLVLHHILGPGSVSGTQ